MKSIIRNFIAKMVAGRSDDGIMITLKDPKKVDFQAAMMEDLLMRNGIDPRAITSETQLKNIINQIKAAEAQRIRNIDVSGIRTIEPGKVFDMEGKQIPRGSDIMGGKAVPGTSDRERVRNEMKTKYGFTDKRLDEIENTPVDEKMADDLLREDDERIIKERLEKQNKDSVQNILDRKNREDVYGLEDYDTTNMSEIQKEIIRTETKLGNLNPNNPGFREQAKPLIDKIEALKNKMREDKATGGRIGFKGGADMSTVADSKGNVGAKSVNVSPSGSVTTSRTKGPDGPDDRGNADQNFTQYLVNQGYTPKEINRITKGPNLLQKTFNKYNSLPFYAKGAINTMAPVELMKLFNIGNALNTGYDKITNPYYEEEDLTLGGIGGMATGGRIGYKLGAGKKGVQALLDLVRDKFGKKSITTADKAPTPPKTLERNMFKTAEERFNKTDSDIYEDSLKGLEDLGAPKLAERFRLKRKYPGITDDLLDKILIDDNMQRKAEVLATIDEVFRMMEKGKGTDEILDTMKNVTRTKQADGGIMRANFLGGGMGRRGFLKMLAGLGAGIGAAKTGLLKLAGKEPVEQVAKEVVQKSTTTPPPYFFKLAEKIKKFGSDTTPTNERTIAKSLKSKDGTADYILEEDMATGDIQIKKVNMERDDMINDIEIMEFRKGEVVQGKDGRAIKTPDEYDEVTESISRIYKDNFNDPDYSEGIRVKEVMEEVMDAPSIKKASGGIARMLGE